MQAHCKTGIEWIYADCGKFNLKAIIQVRRLMYQWEILNRDKNELINRIFQTQTNYNNTGDWVRLVQADKQELEIDLTDEEIQGVSKFTFKSYVKKKVTINHLKYLESLKKKHSKAEHLNCSELKQADYLHDQNFSTHEKRLLFKLRSKTIDVKQNFPGLNKDMWCTSCGLFPENQSHLLQCPALVVHLGYLAGETSTLNENYIYGSTEQKRSIVKIFSDILEVRDNLQQKMRDLEK